MARLNTALEQHIEVLQGLQKVDSYKQDMFQAPEIDLQLNKQQDRFIDDLFGKDFQDRQMRLDFIRPLIVKNHKLIAVTPISSELIYEPDMVYGILPPDYLYRVNDRSQVGQSLTSCQDLSSLIETTEIIEYVSVLPFPITTLTEPPYYNTFEIAKTESALESVIYTSPPAFTGYLTDKEAKYMIINNSLESMNRTLGPTTRIYWESYRGEYHANSYIFVRDTAAWTQVKATAYKLTSPATIDKETISSFTGKTYQKTDFKSGTPSTTLKYVDNQMTEGDKLYELNKNNYYKTDVQEPISAMSADFIHIYKNKSFIIREVVIDYVRKPRQISLLLDQSCELSSVAARANIVDKTIEYMKLLIENPVYREFQRDNIIKNQNN